MRSKTERPIGPMMMVMMFVVAFVAASCGGNDTAVADEDWHAMLVEDGLTPTQADCVIADLADVGLTPGDITDEALGDDEVPEAAVDVMFNCIMGRDASTLLDGVEPIDLDIDPDTIDTTPAGGAAYGDDPALDALWDACAAGDAEACDDLFWSSPLGSEYEQFGMTCGERVDGSFTSCVREMG